MGYRRRKGKGEGGEEKEIKLEVGMKKRREKMQDKTRAGMGVSQECYV